jgi:2-dehydro-3-deoxyphosphogluconate aldolase/(4S)-4-hydroxy-2-oxoglutarate aldolase
MAVRAGAAAVKLFPASALGPGYWRSLAGPLGPLPFCIAAGGLRADDVPAWLAAGVDAVALGNSLFVDGAATGADGGSTPRLGSDLTVLLTRLAAPADREWLST